MSLDRPMRAWMPFAGMAVIVLTALVVSASGSVLRREAVLRVPNQEAVALLRAPERVCQGPVSAAGSAQAAAIWGSSVIGPARVRVDVEDARSKTALAAGRVRTTTNGEHVVRLNRSIPAGRPVRVCLTGELNTFVVLGGPTTSPDVAMTGPKRGLEFSLALLNDRHSLLASLPTAFSRAALFKPSWVGSWTFWLLTAGLLATFGLAGLAIAAASADDEDGHPDAPADGG